MTSVQQLWPSYSHHWPPLLGPSIICEDPTGEDATWILLSILLFLFSHAIYPSEGPGPKEHGRVALLDKDIPGQQ